MLVEASLQIEKNCGQRSHGAAVDKNTSQEPIHEYQREKRVRVPGVELTTVVMAGTALKQCPRSLPLKPPTSGLRKDTLKPPCATSYR